MTLADALHACILVVPMAISKGFRALAAVLVLGACVAQGDTTPGVGTSDGGPDSAAPDTTPPADTSGSSGPTGSGGTGDVTMQSAEGSMSGGGSSSDGGTTGATETPRWQELIAADPYPRLVIEVDYVAGREPRETSIEQLEMILESVLDKPGGVDVVLDEELDSLGPSHAWTIEERVQLAIATSNLQVPNDTIKIHTLSLDGHAAEDDEMDGVLLGIAWGFENIVLWRDTLDGGCMGVGMLVDELCAQAELLIWQHEVGHVIGLVDGGLPMVTDHLDPTPGAGKHDVDHACVMFREYEGLDAIDATLDRLLMGGPAIELDAACLADIDAAK